MERRSKGELWREGRIKFLREEEKLVNNRKKKPIRTFPKRSDSTQRGAMVYPFINSRVGWDVQEGTHTPALCH